MACRYFVAIAAVVAFALVAPGTSSAGVPQPSTSTVPTHFVGSPDGLIVTEVIVRDLAYNPLRNVWVTLDFSNCAGFDPCPMACTDCTTLPANKIVARFTDAAGSARFDLRMGASGCPNQYNAFRVYGDGVILGSPSFASFDQDGDLSVTSVDVAQVQALVGSTDLRADFDGDGAVTASDVAIAQAHLGATCALPSAAHKSSWGSLKSIYR